MNEYDIKVYFEKNKIYTNLDVLVQHDYNSTKLNFTFDKEGRVLFKLKAPNGDNILNTQVVNNEIILEPGVLSQVGDYEAEISLYGNDSKLTNYQTLNFYVRDVLINTDEIIEPSHEKEILDQLINDVNTLDSTVTSNEATRQSNEQTRVSNENTRINNETTRQSNETAREEYIDQLKQDVKDGKFDGKDGEDGYTPQKGIDYYTEEEKEEMIDYIVNDANSEFNRNVNEKTTAFNTNATNKTTDFNSNASSKLDTYNSNHTSKMNAYNQNATDKTTAYNTNATNQTNAYDNNASSKLTAYNDNATEKLSAYNTNHTEKLTAYNDNASDKLDEYNDNAQEKIDEFNENKEELQREVDYYKSTLNALPKVEVEGTELTLNDTAEAPMPMSLAPSALSQYTTTGKQLIPYPYEDTTKSGGGINWTCNADGTILVNGSNTSGSTQFFNIHGTNDGGFILPAGTYIFSLGIASKVRASIILYDDSTTVCAISQNSENATFTLSEETKLRAFLAVNNNASVSYVLIQPMIRLSSIADSTYEPYTNGPSPNPDYPQDIHTISGDNEIKVENINLWDEKWEIGGYNTTTGIKDTSQDKIRNKYPISCEPNAQYYVCINNSESSNMIRTLYYDKNMNFISTVSSIRNTTITTPANTYYMNVMCTTAYGTTYKNDICINTSNASINGNYYPHQEQSRPLNLGDLEYSKIGDYEDEFVIPSGKNIFDLKAYLTTRNVSYTENIDGSITFTTSAALINQPLQFSVENTIVSLSGNVSSSTATNFRFELLNSNDETVANMNGTTITKIENKNCCKIRMSWGSGGTVTMNNIQLELGSTATTYEPYPDGKWYLKKNVGKVVLNGSEEWTLFNTSSVRNVFKVRIIGIEGYSNGSSKPKLLATRFISKSYNATWKIGDISRLTDTDNQNVIVLVYEPNTTVETFKSWLSTHNTIVDYVLANPEYILLNDTLQSQLTEIYKWVKAYQDQTNISQVNNDLPFAIKASAVYDLSKLMTRVEVLESEV